MQKSLLALTLKNYSGSDNVFHHGDCVGGDEEGHRIAERLSWQIGIHPPINEKHRAFCKSDHVVILMYEPLDYLARNHAIVKASSLMIACPGSLMEVLRSGTWATIRHAKAVGKPLLIIYPNGRLELA